MPASNVPFCRSTPFKEMWKRGNLDVTYRGLIF
jgi:hypothetical protein